MSLTLAYDTPRASRIGRNYRLVTGTIAFDSSYPTGGEALDLSGKLKTLKSVMLENKSGYVFEYDYANKLVKAYYYDYDAGADGAAIEVANTTDLSAVTGVRFTAIGIT